MRKETTVLRLVRNLAISIFSACWVYPLYLYTGLVLDFLKIQEDEWATKELGFTTEVPFSMAELIRIFWNAGLLFLSMSIIFWAFVAANKLWPIKKQS
jgi:hypothetical protein